MNICKVDNTSWFGDIQNCPTCQDRATEAVKSENARLKERIEKLREALDNYVDINNDGGPNSAMQAVLADDSLTEGDK